MYIFGIDIGGTSVKIGLFKDTFELLEQWEISTHPESLFEEVSESIKKFLKKQEISFAQIFGYGVGVPGMVKNGIALSCVNLGWQNVDVKEEFSKALGYDARVYVFNDANIAAFGEAAYLNSKWDSVIFITLGTGVGGGIIFHHEIIEGADGLGGEIGHICIDDKYHLTCGCGKIGCLETIASATGMLRLAQYYRDKLPTKLDLNGKLAAKDIIDAAKEEDPLASCVFDEACQALAKAMANLSVIINPDAFIIGGGVSNAGAFLLERIKKHYANVCIKQAAHTNINLAVLKNNAGIYGACAYLINKKHEVEKNGKC
ncbi:MAG: ROK family protein [Anaeroplasmataceae bacterium]|nr:ROK family protein [Anaeroplasmataceae bacterium]MDE6415256.1 ROK family protein [Anaeroplasmataceae bacterium]